MPLDFSNPVIIRIYEEAMHKERQCRRTWFEKNKDKVIDASKFEKEKGWRGEDVARVKQEMDTKIVAQFYKDTLHCRRKRSKDVILGIDKLQTRPQNLNSQIAKFMDEFNDEKGDHGPMKPPDEEEKRILLGPKPYEGRLRYLEERAKRAPDEKYFYQHCTSWNYGWRSEESDDLRLTKKFGRRFVMTGKAGYSRVHLNRDPDHYFRPTAEMDKCPPTFILP